jgi:hypothetical protein
MQEGACIRRVYGLIRAGGEGGRRFGASQRRQTISVTRKATVYEARFQPDTKSRGAVAAGADGNFGARWRERMAAGTKHRGAKPAGGIEAKEPEKPKPAANKAALVRKVIAKIEKKLDDDELKPTVGDLLRLLQLQKEFAEEQPREIKVLWVEPGEKENAPAK